MRAWEWAVGITGALLALLVLADVFLTVLHMKRDGPIARAITRSVWNGSRALGRSFPAWTPILGPLAGPLALAAIFGAWLGLFIVAFAMSYWPHLELFHSASALSPAGFSAALYYSGNVSTVLGFGDITPLGPGLRALTVVQAGLGFGIVTAAVTHLINVIGSAGRRNALTHRIWLQSGRTGDGLETLLSQLRSEEVSDVRGRFLSLSSSLCNLEEQLQRLPVVDLLYRSGVPEHDPEMLLRSSADMAVGGEIVATGPEGRRLGPAARELGRIVTTMMRNGTRAWFGPEALERFDRASTEPADLERIEEVRGALACRLPRLAVPDDLEPDGELVALQSRLRIFVDEARAGTIWC